MKFFKLSTQIILFAVSCNLIAAEPSAGKSQYAICATCHGPNGEGNKMLNAPRLAGQANWYLTKQIKNFKEGIRGSSPKDIYGMQMRPMAMVLATDKAVADVSAYVSSLEVKASKATIKGDIAKGKQLYAVCATCHGAEGEGNKILNAPVLKGMEDWYMVRQLQYYRDGIRGTHAKDIIGAQMRPMAMTLPNDAAINDVVAFIKSLK